MQSIMSGTVSFKGNFHIYQVACQHPCWYMLSTRFGAALILSDTELNERGVNIEKLFKRGFKSLHDRNGLM